MDINRNNCEAYFLDFFEGRLSPEQAELLFAFLDEHPDLHELFNNYEHIGLDDESGVNFEGKETLKRFADLPLTVNEANCEEFFIAAAEGLLNADEQKRVEQFLAQHPERRADYDAFAKTRLQPEEIVFEHKGSLKKTLEPVSASNYEDYILSAIEGLLNAQQRKELDTFIASDPVYAAVFAQYQQTRLQPDLSVVFEDKASLKRRARGTPWMPVWRAAAAFAVLVLAGYGITRLANGGPVDADGLAGNSALKNREVTPVVIPVPDNNNGTQQANYASNNGTQKISPLDTTKPVRENLFAASFNPREIQGIRQKETEPGMLALAGYTPLSSGTTTQQAYPEYNFPTVREMAEDWALEKLGGKPTEPATGVMAMNQQKESMTGWDWAGLAMKKVSNEKITLEKSADENGRVLNVRLGKIKFKHTFSK
ncbi:MAG: hypothetical protein FD123_2142 [Bacteroidetes bacterium]|nr:MAG: hypothetical protein FD123_2142 [Bacteroidota bacterium]